MTMKPGRIAKLRLTDVSLVGEGDNPGAEVEILKSRNRDSEARTALTEVMEAVGDLIDLAAGEGGEEGVEKAARILGGLDMDLEQLQQRLETIEASLTAVEKARDEAIERADKAEAEVTKLTEALEKAKQPEPAKGDDEDDVLKGLPQAVRDRIEKAEKTAADAAEAIEKANDKAELDSQIAKARELDVADADAVGGLLHRIAKGKSTAEDAAKVIEVLKVAKNVADAEGRLFKAIGKAKGDDAPNDAEGKLNEAIVAIQKAKPGLTREQAYAEAIDANPALYDEVKKIKPVGAE